MAIEHYRVQVDGKWVDVSLEKKGDKLIARSGDASWEADLRHVGETILVSLLLDTQSLDLLVYRDRDRYAILRDTEHYDVVVKPAWATLAGRAGVEESETAEVTVESPLIGVIAEVRVEAGQEVQKGAVLVVLEAMKMQNELRAPRAGTVKSVRARPGQKVAPRQILVVLG